jgi:hypothetical protein
MRITNVRGRRGSQALIAAVGLVISAGAFSIMAPASSGATTRLMPKATGGLDCNGLSPIQRSVRVTMACTDIKGIVGVSNANTSDGHFLDNGRYIGHDEPDMTVLSGKPGSGGDVTWTETLGKDPAAAPTVATPGSDVTHQFELTVAPWFSMAMCDGNSYPLLPCTPNSDSNAPACTGVACSPNSYPGAGGAFMEMQFYPPGFAPFADNISCDNTHWCSALNIDSLECTLNFNQCNPNCEEPVNFAFIQTDGVPAGPPSPQLTDLNTFTPNANTLLMNPGDRITVHMSDAAAPGGGKAFKVVIQDLTTGKSGFMQASAANGFANTSIVDCSGTPFNFEPTYSTAGKGHITPWTALQTDISTQFEIGHFEGCTSLTNPSLNELAPGVFDKTFNTCHGPYERSAAGGDVNSPEPTDAPCYPKGDTHGQLATAPNVVTGCDVIAAGGDLDFDGSPYWSDWPMTTSPTATFPASFVQALPTTAGQQYPQMFLQTDVALSESTCSSASTVGCTVPPSGPGNFYPYWSRTRVGGTCSILFGNVATGANTFGKDAQYGHDLVATLGYSEFEGQVRPNACA